MESLDSPFTRKITSLESRLVRVHLHSAYHKKTALRRLWRRWQGSVSGKRTNRRIVPCSIDWLDVVGKDYCLNRIDLNLAPFFHKMTKSHYFYLITWFGWATDVRNDARTLDDGRRRIVGPIKKLSLRTGYPIFINMYPRIVVLWLNYL